MFHVRQPFTNPVARQKRSGLEHNSEWDLINTVPTERNNHGVSNWWLLITGAAAFGIAVWLRSLDARVLIAGLVGSLIALGAVRAARGGAIGWLACGLLTLTFVVGLSYQRRLSGLENNWDRYAARVAEQGIVVLRDAVQREVALLDALTKSALIAPVGAEDAFRYLESLGPYSPYRGVVLADRSGPMAWAGTLRSPEAAESEGSGIQWTPFYIVIRRVARGGGRVVTADAVLHAEPPADRIAGSLDAGLPMGPEVDGFLYRDVDRTSSSEWQLIPVGDRFVAVQPRLLSQGEAIQRVSESARVWGGVGLLLSVVMLVAVAWRRPASLARRFSVLGALLAMIMILPFSAYSNRSTWFDPAVYYAPILGALSGSIAALTATSALALLGFFALGRAGVRIRGRWIPALAVVLVASLGPFLLRDLSRGISLPGQGASTQLWLSWQLPLFLAAAAILLAGASAGRMLVDRRRGVSPWFAPAVAAVAALLAPQLWLAPGRWPAWYVMVWIVAMAALALARRSRALVTSAGIVAACGAATLTWYAVSRARVELAEQEVARLSLPDPATQELIVRLAEAIREGEPPRERSDLLRRFVDSPLAVAGNPVELASWSPAGIGPYAELRIRDFASRVEGEFDLVLRARQTGQVTWRLAESSQGIQTLTAVPHRDSSVTTIVVAPPSRLIEEDAFSLLTGLSRPPMAEPPYDLVLTTVPSPVPLSERPVWERKGNELHGDWLVPGAGEGARAHVEVELRALDVLAPRGALIILLDLLVLGVLWTLVAMSDGGVVRWARSRIGAWARSYRGRLTVTLLMFFLIPTTAFALWSYSRLLQSDRESRELLLGETLRAVVKIGGDDLAAVSERFDTPLLAYQGGQLLRASDSIYSQLAPVGRYLPREVQIGLGVEGEVTMATRPVVAGVPLLLGYRPFAQSGGGRAVLAAPARFTERVLDRERRDIGVLVLFAASLGALAALALSGLAARELERPVGALRLAALRIARGERYPPPERAPAKEFVPVFSAFERMDTDLATSRAALEEAQRRTESVLRDVASAVIAVDRNGRVTLANPSADAVLGRPVLPGLTLRELEQDGLAVRTDAFLDGSNTEVDFDETIGGRQVRGSLAHLERGAGGAVLTLEDVTELARAQRVLAWGEMARQVAHEIKNPLTPIRLGVQHLRRARGDSRVDFARIFEQNVERILAEIDRLDEIARAFSRYGMSPAERLDPVPLDIGAITRDVVDLERMAADGVAWHVSAPAGPVIGLARDDELREVLLNVMENARQAGANRIDVDVIAAADRVEVTVRDDGDGVTSDDLERIFEPRFSTRTSGSGLGLAISRNMVEAWGGRMRAERVPDGGTVMHISLAAGPTR